MTQENFRLKRMARLARPFDRIADIGYAQYPNPYLNNAHVTGIDMASPEKLPANYDKTFRGTIRDYSDAESDRFDAVIAGELLEHLEDPMGFLRDCFNLLSSSGTLILSTPNPNSPIEQLLTVTLSRKYFYTDDHVMLFPQRWLIRMLERSGFVGVELHSGGFPVPGLGLIPFPRPWCYQTIAVARKP